MSTEELSGWLATVFTTLIFVPQLYKAFTTKKTKDLSMMMLILAIMGNSAWLVQASITSNMPLMVCAVLIIIMSTILILFKYHNDRKQQG